MASAKIFVETILKQYPVAVFSKVHCPYCTKAKSTLSSFDLKPDHYKVIELDGRNDMSEIQDYLKDITGGR
uniref:Glutaredoxin domain-containing protein n=1 Tax=Panagrolaimus sp. JU765 TaxID=591449 RepID=A0AC34PU98_9BILA